MKNRKLLDSNRELQNLRQESLNQLSYTSMRSHGKLWGMDVFAWYDADAELLCNTIQAFPFQVSWIARYEEVESVYALDHRIGTNLAHLILYRNQLHQLDRKLLAQINRCYGTEDIHAAFSLCQHIQSEKKILLFTASGTTKTLDKECFESILQTEQTLK
jgi:hypothetical protein